VIRNLRHATVAQHGRIYQRTGRGCGRMPGYRGMVGMVDKACDTCDTGHGQTGAGRRCRGRAGLASEHRLARISEEAGR